jgi:hypothetical protein
MYLQKSLNKHISTVLVIEFCNFVNLYNRGEGLAYTKPLRTWHCVPRAKSVALARGHATTPSLPPLDFLFLPSD